MADWVKEISDRAKQGLDIAKEAVTDKDALNQLKYHLAETAINALYTGKGSSVTKIVTVCLISVITVSLLVKLLIDGDDSGIRVVDLLLGPGMLTGSYAAGKTIQKVAERKYNNGNGGRNMRPASSYRPDHLASDDRRPSDTKRDHPGR